MSSSISSTVSTYLEDCKVGLSQATLDVYGWSLHRLADYLAAQVTNLADVSAQHLRAFFGHIQDEGYSKASVHSYYRSIRTFFGWCVRQGLIVGNPMLAVRRPVLPSPVPKYVNSSDIPCLIEAAKATTKPIRDYAILLVFLDCGLRREELSALSLADVDLSSHLLTVRLSKMGKGRIVPFSSGTATALAVWLKERPEDTRGLFGLTGDGVYLLVGRLSRKCGVKFSPHSLRHTFATYYDGDIQDVQKILGHSDVSTTASIYRFRDVLALVKVHDERSFVAKLAQTK